MELLSVIVALEMLKSDNSAITIYSDSRYVVDAVEKGWLTNWSRKGFKDKKNVDLWRRFLQVYPRHKAKFMWVKGHAGNTYNERVDKLAVEAALGKELLADEGYEAESPGLFN